MKIVYLAISTYMNLIPEAQHYRGELQCGRAEPVGLSYRMSARDAAHFNRWDGFGYTWKAGGTSRRFQDEDVLIANAIACYRDHFPEAVLLLKGNRIYRLSPLPALDGPEDIVKAANDLVARADANDWYEGDRATMDQIDREWEALLASVNGESE